MNLEDFKGRDDLRREVEEITHREVMKTRVWSCEREYRATDNAAYAWRAISYCNSAGVPLPEWIMAYLAKTADRVTSHTVNATGEPMNLTFGLPKNTWGGVRKAMQGVDTAVDASYAADSAGSGDPGAYEAFGLERPQAGGSNFWKCAAAGRAIRAGEKPKRRRRS